MGYKVPHARTVMEQALQPMLQRFGYRIRREPYVTYIRAHDGIEHAIWPNMSNARAHIQISITVRLMYDACPELHDRWPRDANGRPLSAQVHAPLMSFTDAAAFDQFAYKRGEFQLHRDHHFPILADCCEQILRHDLEPLLARCHTLEALDEFLNAPGHAPAQAFADRMPDTIRLETALVVAHLADRGRFDAVRDAAAAFAAQGGGGHRTSGPALTSLEVGRIRESIDRLVAFRASSAWAR